jgi:hypothetical protein
VRHKFASETTVHLTHPWRRVDLSFGRTEKVFLSRVPAATRMALTSIGFYRPKGSKAVVKLNGMRTEFKVRSVCSDGEVVLVKI